MRYISAVVVYLPEEEGEEENCVFDLNKMNRKISSMNMTREVKVLVRNKEIDIGTSYVPYIKTFQSSERHTDVTTYDLSERWGISLSQDTRTLKKNTQKFLHSSIIELDSRYRTYRVFTRKKLLVQWPCETMNERYKSTDGNHHAQVFANISYFSKVYLIY